MFRFVIVDSIVYELNNSTSFIVCCNSLLVFALTFSLSLILYPRPQSLAAKTQKAKRYKMIGQKSSDGRYRTT